jgi:hypothetical protein
MRTLISQHQIDAVVSMSGVEPCAGTGAYSPSQA